MATSDADKKRIAVKLQRLSLKSPGHALTK
jgi:hypothetical protein